ncbi:MAG: CoA-transferase subunit beta [Acidobacteria bacterium]|nr:MAG: CoA-transferase subunit beta [Acidobacteriota bacterium]
MTHCAEDYTIDELMVVTLARQFTSDDIILNGTVSFIPVAAILLARETHAPGLTWVAGAVGVDAQPGYLMGNTLDPTMWKNCVMYLPQWEDMWSYVHRGTLETFCIRGAQIDKYGNVNNTVIGDYYHPKVRLPGSAGMGDMGSLDKRIFIWSTTHNRRTFVERVDFLGCVGYLDGGDSRERLGLKNGPQLVITDLGVMDFEPESKRMRLRSVHRGVTVEHVREQTGFELVIPDEVPETPPPTEREIHLLRDVIDPKGMRKLEFRGAGKSVK